MKIFVISSDLGNRKNFAEAIQINHTLNEEINCSLCSNHWRKENVESDTVKIALSNDHFPDFLDAISSFYVNEKFSSIISDERLTGYYTF